MDRWGYPAHIHLNQVSDQSAMISAVIFLCTISAVTAPAWPPWVLQSAGEIERVNIMVSLNVNLLGYVLWFCRGHVIPKRALAPNMACSQAFPASSFEGLQVIKNWKWERLGNKAYLWQSFHAWSWPVISCFTCRKLIQQLPWVGCTVTLCTINLNRQYNTENHQSLHMPLQLQTPEQVSHLCYIKDAIVTKLSKAKFEGLTTWCVSLSYTLGSCMPRPNPSDHVSHAFYYRGCVFNIITS